MDQLTTQHLIPLVILPGLALLMMWTGARVRMLEQRHTPKRCPSCGLLRGRLRRCRCL